MNTAVLPHQQTVPGASGAHEKKSREVLMYQEGLFSLQDQEA